MARIKGSNNTKALLLLSHYDSAPHSYSYGASDAGSGVATILEGLRAFIHNKTPHKNDIIILFSDAEEIGLNGAALFVSQNNWAKEIGLVLNFEARGTAGPSYMLLEVNHGNAALVHGFKKANPGFPVSNSLMYSIYKMLPNDTDLTVFREQGQIQGFNFAFIDNHFNYHTAQDDFAHVNPSTVAHQGTYLMPMMEYFSNADLTKMNSTEDEVYFNTPYYFVSYPFGWILPMWIGAILLFSVLIFIGIGKRLFTLKEIGKGFIPLFGSLIVAGLVTFLGWEIILKSYPQYNDILQGFTYNGLAYISAFVCLSLAIGFLFYTKLTSEKLVMSHTIAPLFLWICINLALVLYLPGAGFFIIPVYFSLFMLAYYIISQKTNRILNLLLAIPALIVFFPFIKMFPIGLGLKILAGSAVLTILVFGLLLPVFGLFRRKGISALVLFAISLGFFVFAHFHSNYEAGKAKPNSLLYVYDVDKNKAEWASYDTNLDEWTKLYLGSKPKIATSLNTNPLYSKYHSNFTFSAPAPAKNILPPTIEFTTDTIIGKLRLLKIKISPNRKVNRYDVFANETTFFYDFKANNTSLIGQKGRLFQRKDRKLISYYVVNNEPLELQFSISKRAILDMSLMESSFDLMSNPLFNMQKRKSWMMPSPFVLNDAVVVKKQIKPTPKRIVVMPEPYKNKFKIEKKSLKNLKDSLK